MSIEDIEKWRSRLCGFLSPSAVLREMAEAYGVNKSTLGFMLSDLHPDTSAEAVQAVWLWDIAKNGKGFSDAELDDILATLQETIKK